MNNAARIALPACLGVFGSVAAWCFPFGPPAARTIAPGDRPGASCTVCHAGAAVNSMGGNIRVAFPNGLTYTPGQAQDLAVTITDPSAAVYGFEMTARPDNAPGGGPAGSFTAGADQRIVCSDNQAQPAGGCGGNGIQWIEHSKPSLTGAFTVRWTAPSAGAGNVHIYVSGNAANGDNTSRGDHIYTAEYVLVPASTATTGVPVIRSIASAAGGGSAIQSGSWITISGSNFATSETNWDKSITSDNVFPTTLGGVTVSVNGKPAPISFVNGTQINALAPLDTSIGPASVIVSNSTGSSAPATAQIDSQSPGFFTFNDKYVAGLVLDGGTAYQYLAPSGSLSGVQSRAAKAGDTILLYGTGFGRTVTVLNPNMAATVAYPLAHTGADIQAPTTTVTIGGQNAQVTFAGLVSPGVYQLNVVVPQVAAGDQPVVLKLLSGPTTTQQVFVPVQ